MSAHKCYSCQEHEVQGPFRRKGEGEGPELESLETTFTEEGDQAFFASGYSAREIAQHRAKIQFAGKLDRSLLSTERQPLDRIADFIADARAGMVRHHFRRGCLIGNLGQDSPALPEAYRDRLERVFLDWQARLARCLELARDAGLIADSANCNELAEFFWIGWEGAVLRSKLMASPRPLDVFTTAFFSMLPR